MEAQEKRKLMREIEDLLEGADEATVRAIIEFIKEIV